MKWWVVNLKYVIDTNGLLNAPSLITNRNDIVITSIVLRELENLETKRGDRVLQYQLRNVKRALRIAVDGNKDIFDTNEVLIDSEYDVHYADNMIFEYAKLYKYGIITDDLLLELKARNANIPVLRTNEATVQEGEYTGFKEITLTDTGIQSLYYNLDDNRWGLLPNEYLIVRDRAHPEIVREAFSWRKQPETSGYDDGYCLEPINPYGKDLYRQCTTGVSFLKAKDVYQSIAMHSIDSNQMTLITGPAGSGKTMIGVNKAMSMLSGSGLWHADKLVFFFNPVPAKDSAELGLYKGTKDEKSMQSSIGGMLRSRIGSDKLNQMLCNEKIELMPFVDLRGYSTNDKENTIIYISEAQNLTKELMKLGLQRAGKNTKVIIDGDVDAQLDRDVYEYNNGLLRTSEVFRGHDMFGQVELQKVYRSEIASIADTM